ncbi:MAG TPA: S8 family peptidase [Longimicrobiales bacterium]
MRPLSMLLAVAFALGACAPTRAPSEGPAPSTTQPERPRAEARPARPADEPLDAAPENWWLLDAATAGVRGAGVERAYRELLDGKEPRRTVVVAVIDGGVDIEHEDLDGVLWVNDDETPGNGKDDDGNGYVDDVHGWNFIGGPDGRHVHQDTYEVTRLYAACQEGGAAADAARCDEIEKAYQQERAEAEQMLGQVRQIDMALDQFTALLRSHLGVDTLSVEQVEGIASPRADVQQARQVFLQLAANGITPDIVDEELERLENRIKYGLDPSFDPRPIVGDDYDDASQRLYGNADVEGPEAGHGTHVAGIIAAERGNGLGIDGIASGVRIMAIRAVPDGDERDKDVANAIRYAVDNGAHIINMSFGKGYSPGKSAVDDAVRYAESKGVLLVHAAGNDGANLAAETNFPNRFFENGDTARLWIEVGASSWKGADQLAAPFSNYGKAQVHVFAPGVDIRSTVPDDAYRANSGTSMAAPVVSGLAALIMAYYPELDAADVKRILLDSATPYAGQTVVRPGSQDERVDFGELSATGGIVNAYAALRMAERVAEGKR